MRVLLSLIIGLTLVTPVSAACFPDSEYHRFHTQINALKNQGAVQGYPDGTFRPDALVSRAEFLKVLMWWSGWGTDAQYPDGCFTDFVGQEQWFWQSACHAKQQGIINGYPDGTFRPTQNINLVEALKMTENALGIPQPQYFREPDHWYDPYIDAAASYGMFDDIPNQPDRLITRGEMAAMMVRFENAQ